MAHQGTLRDKEPSETNLSKRENQVRERDLTI